MPSLGSAGVKISNRMSNLVKVCEQSATRLAHEPVPR